MIPFSAWFSTSRSRVARRPPRPYIDAAVRRKSCGLTSFHLEPVEHSASLSRATDPGKQVIGAVLRFSDLRHLNQQQKNRATATSAAPGEPSCFSRCARAEWSAPFAVDVARRHSMAITSPPRCAVRSRNRRAARLFQRPVGDARSLGSTSSGFLVEVGRVPRAKFVLRQDARESGRSAPGRAIFAAGFASIHSWSSPKFKNLADERSTRFARRAPREQRSPRADHERRPVGIDGHRAIAPAVEFLSDHPRIVAPSSFLSLRVPLDVERRQRGPRLRPCVFLLRWPGLALVALTSSSRAFAGRVRRGRECRIRVVRRASRWSP